ncbi:zinc-dependent alcohol dehydrogenase family protein [Nocardia sp. NPDC050697]|uniref:zinc-dependent alcohol dehydrogenase family protein n=1 Tax=Nocardia sp. NPDC050697 TaxID=3155158 RepID=UPI0033D24866
MARVVVFDEFGGPEVLRIVEEPVAEPAVGEVRVRIEAFAVNPLDRMMRSGAMPGAVTLPHARLGVEGTGVIDAVGAEVAGFADGDPVVIAALPDAGVRGSYAEYTTLPASRVIARPAGLSVPEAAAIWVAYSTAYGALVEKGGMRPGDHILVTAASGAVGRAALRIAARMGAVPIAVTRDSAKTGELLAAGAAAVIATDRESIADGVRRHAPGGADLVLDLVTGPGQRELLAAARPGAPLIAAGFLDPRPADSPVEHYRSFEHTLDPVVVERMARFLDADRDRPDIDEVFAFDDVVRAHRHLERGRYSGKIVVSV